MTTETQKLCLLLGGFIGFILTFCIGIYTHQELLYNLLHATIGCIVGTVLIKLLLFIVQIHQTKPKGEDNEKTSNQ